MKMDMPKPDESTIARLKADGWVFLGYLPLLPPMTPGRMKRLRVLANKHLRTTDPVKVESLINW